LFFSGKEIGPFLLKSVSVKVVSGLHQDDQNDYAPFSSRFFWRDKRMPFVELRKVRRLVAMPVISTATRIGPWRN